MLYADNAKLKFFNEPFKQKIWHHLKMQMNFEAKQKQMSN